MLLKPQLRVQEYACVRMLWPAYVGCYPCTWVEDHFGHYFQKQIFMHLKSYIFHFNTPQFNLIFDWALNWSWSLEFEHLQGMGVRVIKGTKCNVYTTRLAFFTSLHLCTLASIFMHEFVCRLYSNPMELWTLNPRTPSFV